MLVTACNVCHGSHTQELLPFVLNEHGDWVTDCPSYAHARAAGETIPMIKVMDDIPKVFKTNKEVSVIGTHWLAA